ncbi:aldo/keto reductase, partial [Pseudomonas sp. MWU12-2312b]
MWRGSLLPLGCEAPLKPSDRFFQKLRVFSITTASQPNGSKLPR